MLKRIPRLSRRRFLQTTGLLMAPAVVPRSVFGAEGKPPPSERLTVGFIGCGKMANDYHLSTLLKFDDVQALAVCEVDQNRRQHARQRVEKAYANRTDYKGCAEFVDFRELLARPDIDAGLLAWPASALGSSALGVCGAGSSQSLDGLRPERPLAINTFVNEWVQCCPRRARKNPNSNWV